MTEQKLQTGYILYNPLHTVFVICGSEDVNLDQQLVEKINVFNTSRLHANAV